MTDAARAILRDSFTRLIEHVDELTNDLSDEVAFYRPTTVSGQQANSIAWLIWHSARITDAQLAHIAAIEQVWFRDGWVDRFALDLPRDAHGYGHTPDEVGKVRAPGNLLKGYYHAVHRMSLEYVAGVTDEELARAAVRFPINPPMNKEGYLYRTTFERLFPSAACAATVPGGKSVACSTEKALEWSASLQNVNDPSGRAVAGVHRSAYGK